MYGFDSGLFTVTTTNEDGVKQKAVMSAFGPTASTSTYPKGIEAKTQFAYGPFDELLQVTDAAGNVVTEKYDALGRVTELDDRDFGYTSSANNGIRTSYNAFDETESQKDAAGTIIALRHDDLGRLIERCQRSGASCVATDMDTYSYDHPYGMGRLARKTRGANYTDYTYDTTTGQLSLERWNVDGVNYDYNYAYDGYGSLSQTTYPAATGQPQRFITKNVFTNHYVTSMVDVNANRTIWTATTQDADGNFTQEKLANGLVTSTAFEPETGRLSSIATAGIPYYPHAAIYKYSAGGNITSRSSRISGPPYATVDKAETLSYDVADRLQWSQIEGGTKYVFDYDAIGNTVAANDSLAGCTTTFGGAGVGPHALTSFTCSGTTYRVSYDAKGNTTSWWDGNAYTAMTYTSFNKPTTMDNEFGGMKYTYDADHIRIKKERTVARVAVPPAANESGLWGTTVSVGLFEKRSGPNQPTTDFVHRVFANGHVVAERFWHWNGSTGYADWHYIHSDVLGSAERATDDTGAALDRTSYDAWGTLRDPSLGGGPPSWAPQVPGVGYTGHNMDWESHTIDMGGRQFLPALHRFLEPDVVVPRSLYGPAWNRYAYAYNNPLRFTDPNGHAPSSIYGTNSSAAFLIGAGLDGGIGLLTFFLDAAGRVTGNPITAGIIREPFTKQDAAYRDGLMAANTRVKVTSRVYKRTFAGVSAPEEEGPSGGVDTSGFVADADPPAWFFKRFGIPTSLSINLPSWSDIEDSIRDSDGAKDYAKSKETFDPPATNAGGWMSGQVVDDTPAVSGGLFLGLAGGELGAAEGGAARGTTGFVSDTTVLSKGKVVGRGTVDVRATVEGIESGKLAPRDVFQNREGLLPKQAPGYYKEFVQPTPGVKGAGPQRIIQGRGGELFYTPDHYKTFIPLK